MSGFVKDTFLQRYFSQEARTTSGAGPDVMMTYRKVSEPISLYNRWLSFWWKDALFVYIFSVLMSLKVVFSDRCVICLPICSFFFNVQHLDDVHSRNVMRYMQAINQRVDLSERVKKLKCRTLIIFGEHSPFHHEALHLSTQMHRRYNALIEVQACGSLVTEEQPHAMFVPMELFLMGYSFYQRPVYSLSSTPTSPLSPPCVSPELLSPESLGLKLKPIKTRVSVPEEENC